MAPNKNGLTDTGKLLIHEFRNCVHRINMELDLAERGLDKKVEYDDLISAVDSMNRSLEELRVRLVSGTRQGRRDKNR
jgi:hypothetical protein